MKTQLKLLAVSNEIIDTNLNLHTKFILAYIQFRLNNEKIDWTFSQADIARQTQIDKSHVNRLFKPLIENGVVKFISYKIITNGKIKLFTANQAALDSFIISNTDNTSLTGSTTSLTGSTTSLTGSTTSLTGSTTSLTGSTTSLTGSTYKKDIEELSYKNDNTRMIDNKEISKTIDNTQKQINPVVSGNGLVLVNGLYHKPIEINSDDDLKGVSFEKLSKYINNPQLVSNILPVARYIKKYSEIIIPELEDGVYKKVIGILNKNSV